MSIEPWSLKVLRAFRDAMDAVKPADVPDAFIGWPHLAMTEGPWSPFVWFDPDVIDVVDGADNHMMTVVTGIVFRKDNSIIDQQILEQAIAAYYEMRNAIAQQAEDDESAFNAAFNGYASTHPDDGGVRPSGAKDYDGTCSMGERWLVTGRGGPTGELTS